MLWPWNRYEERTAVGRFGRCTECGQEIASPNIDGPPDAWQPVTYVVIVRARWFTRLPKVCAYHPACAVTARKRAGG